MKQIINDKYGEIQIHTINESCEINQNGYIQACEELYNAQIHIAAQKIKENVESIKIVLLSGPSASGKTTTSFNIAKKLQQFAVHADVISLDDFYLNREYYPKLSNGQPDYESIYALDLDLIHQCFTRILEKKESYFPKYDFHTGQRVIEDRLVQCGKNDVLIVEGIHALNPLLTQNINQHNLIKIYASVRTVFKQGEIELLRPKEIRMMRRLIRDKNFRNSSIENTLNMWENVLKAEYENINPYRDSVDIKIDTTIDYEPCIYHHYLMDMLSNYPQGDPFYSEMQKLSIALQNFYDIQKDCVPEDSLLREFIGN